MSQAAASAPAATQLPPADGDAGAVSGHPESSLSTDRRRSRSVRTPRASARRYRRQCSGLLNRRPRAAAGAAQRAATFAPYGRQFGAGDVVGVTLDRRDGTIRYCINGEDQGVAFVAPPILARAPIHPALAVKGRRSRSAASEQARSRTCRTARRAFAAAASANGGA